MSGDLLKEAVYKTLAYARIFSYPLKKEEIWRWLIWENPDKPSNSGFQKTLARLPLKNRKPYYCLGDFKDVRKRAMRQITSLNKIIFARQVSFLIGKNPFVKLVGISGALAMHNAGKNDDIDLFLICRKDTVWITRFLVTLNLDLKNLRRRPGNKLVKNKICLNLFLDENNLSFKGKNQNLFTAHEICQMLPLINKNKTYEKFLAENIWVKNYLPNALTFSSKPEIEKNNLSTLILNSLFLILNSLFMLPQLLYMQKHHTSETVTNGILKFHPHDKTLIILRKYRQNLQKLAWKPYDIIN